MDEGCHKITHKWVSEKEGRVQRSSKKKDEFVARYQKRIPKTWAQYCWDSIGQEIQKHEISL